MNLFSKWWNRRPARGPAPLGRRFRAEIETFEDRVTPTLTPADFSVAVIGPDTIAEDNAAGTIVRFTRHDGSTAQEFARIAVHGQAKLDVDFTWTGFSGYNQASEVIFFTFETGETSHDVVIKPINNTLHEETKTLEFSVTPGIPPSLARLTFTDDDPPLLTVDMIGPNPLSEEGTDVLTIRYTRRGDTSAPLTLPFDLVGGYLPTVDGELTLTGADSFSHNRGFFTFAAGEAMHDLVIDPIDDAVLEGSQSFLIRIDPLSFDTYFRIVDTDIPRITASLSPDSVAEDGSGAIVVTLKRSGNLTVESRVRFHLTGSAHQDNDYTVTGAAFRDSFRVTPPGFFIGVGQFQPLDSVDHYGLVYFPVGSDVATFVIHPTADTEDEPNETIVITFDPDSQCVIDDGGRLSATIVGNPDLPPPSDPVPAPPYWDNGGGLFGGVIDILPPNDGDSDTGNNPPPSLPLSVGERAIESLYVNRLGRPGESAARANWLSRYNAGTPMKDIVLGFEQSQEYAEKFVREEYQQILRRAPEAEGLAFWSAKIMAGESTDAVIRGMTLSLEYAIGFASNADFVAKTYRTLLGREADAAATGWIQGLDSGGSRAAFVSGLLESREARDRRTRSTYQTYLHRSASDADLTGWYAFVTGSGAAPSQFLAEFLNSGEFLSRANVE